MANAFGRDSPWPGGPGLPPTKSNHPISANKNGKTDSETTMKPQPKENAKTPHKDQVALRTQQVRKNNLSTSQSLNTFVQDPIRSLTPIKIMSPPIVSKAVRVTPDKAKASSKLVPLGNKQTPNRFFTPKRKKGDEENTQWTKEKLINEVSKLWNDDDTKKGKECNKLSEQELRKELYDMVTSSKKHKKKDEVTMDIGSLLVDSTMEYSPMLTENSTDTDIVRLEKHDAILELANYIQKCGKRANMHQLHAKSLPELHEQIKLARDEHKKIHQVFPELTGDDAQWFGPKGERRDRDYEPSVTSEDESNDWWDDLITDDELDTIIHEKNHTVTGPNEIKKTKEEKAYLKNKHDDLFHQLLNEAKKGKLPKIHEPENTHEWTKDKLASTIIPIGKKIGKTLYYTVLMNQTKNYLRAQLATMRTMYKEQKEKKNTHHTKKVNKKEKKTDDEKNKPLEIDQEPGSEGEYEWNDNLATQPDMDKEHEQEVTESNTKPNNTATHHPPAKQKKKITKAKGTTEFKETTPDEIIEMLDRFTIIAIIYKRMKDDSKPLDFLLDESMTELREQLKYFRPLMGKDVLKVSAIDEEYHRQRAIKWGPNSEWGKAQKKNLGKSIPKNFDSELVLPSETTTRESETNAKHHTSFASVDKEDRLNGAITTANTSDVKGVDISLFTPNTSSDTQSINEPPSAKTKQQKPDVVLLIKKTFNVRVAYGLKHRGQHTPTDVKNFVKLLLSIDSNIRILPFKSQDDTRQDHDVITNEEDLPDSQDPLKKWAVDLAISHNNKLHFGMRMTSTLTFAELRRHLFSWCTKTKSFVKFDNIKSTKIFGVGWILGAHPNFHNRNTLKSVLFKNAPDLIEKVTIYPRRVWADSTAKTQRVISNAIVIDGCFFARNKIIQHVCSFKWSGSYSDATFIPFKLSENFTAAHRQKAMQEQNIYLRDMWSKTVTVHNSTGLLKCKQTGRNFSFITWLQLCEVHGQRVLQSVEYIDANKVKILYHKDNEHNVCNMLTHMFPALEKQFGEDKATMLLGNKNEQLQQIKTKSMEHSYADMAAKKVMQRGNPQDDNVNSPPKIKFNSYYGKRTQGNNENRRPNESRESEQSDNNVMSNTNGTRADQANLVTPSKEPSKISNEHREEMNKLREAINDLKSSHSEQTKTIKKLNEKLVETNEDTNSAQSSQESEYSHIQDEIQALWKSQDEKYVELTTTIDTKLQHTKNELLEVVDTNKKGISEEIEKLKVSQEESAKAIREQQSVSSMTLLTAMEKIVKRLDEQNHKLSSLQNTDNPPNPNLPISPVEQGSRHGGEE